MNGIRFLFKALVDAVMEGFGTAFGRERKPLTKEEEPAPDGPEPWRPTIHPREEINPPATKERGHRRMMAGRH